MISRILSKIPEAGIGRELLFCLAIGLSLLALFWWAKPEKPAPAPACPPLSCDHCPAAPPCPPRPKCPKPKACALTEARPSCPAGWVSTRRAYKCIPWTAEDRKIREWVRKKRGEK